MKPIRDSSGKVVAYEHEPNASRHELRSTSGGLLAWHDKITDQSFDKHSKRAGYGDQTARFIPNEE